jgi:hypothetical protein
MIKTELEYGAYYDFIVTKDDRVSTRDYNSLKLFYIDVTEDLCTTIGLKQSEDVILKNISLNGYDNYFIHFGNGTIDPEVEYIVSEDDTFCLHEVSGYTKNLNYDITPKLGYNQLSGGFYQGFFKLYGYPVEFMPNRMRKGWTTNMMLHLPTSGYGTGSTSGTTLNDVFNNPGFIYYLGTRAENKYSDLTPVEVNILKNDYLFTFVDIDNQYTRIGTYQLDGIPYEGYFYIKDGIPYAGRNSSDINIVNNYIYDNIFNIDGAIIPGDDRTGTITGDTQLTYFNKYKDVIDNSFGVRITPDGRIGYRKIYATDPCYTGETQEVSGITTNSFVDFTQDCDNFTMGKIITKYFTIEDSYTKCSVISDQEQILVNEGSDVPDDSTYILFQDGNIWSAQDDSLIIYSSKPKDKYVYVTVTFERDFSYDTKCDLTYGDYKNGTLTISLNGFTVYRNRNFKEVIPHELDTEAKYQEGVPFNISFGGGSQGLYEAIYLDPNKTVDGIIDKFFAGTFNGGVKFIEMYSIPLYITEVREIIKNNLQNYNLYQPKGGRRVFIKNQI